MLIKCNFLLWNDKKVIFFKESPHSFSKTKRNKTNKTKNKAKHNLIFGLNYPYVLNQWTTHKHMNLIWSWSQKQFRLFNHLRLFDRACISLSSFTTLQIVCVVYSFKAPATIRLMQLAYSLFLSLLSKYSYTLAASSPVLIYCLLLILSVKCVFHHHHNDILRDHSELTPLSWTSVLGSSSNQCILMSLHHSRIKCMSLIRLSKPLGCVLEKQSNWPFNCLF